MNHFSNGMHKPGMDAQTNPHRGGGLQSNRLEHLCRLAFAGRGFFRSTHNQRNMTWLS